MGAQLHTRGVDGAIAALAGRQHGVASRRQLLELGLGRRAIGHRIERGRLHAVHRGVYAVGHRVLSPRGAWMAAVLAVGDDAVLSHRSAAALWGIRPFTGTRVDVSADRHLRSRAGLRFHAVRLAPDEVTTRDAIPVTTPPRTLLDLAAVVPAHQLERAMNEAERQHLADLLSLDAVLRRHAGANGTRALRRALERVQPGGLAVTRSDLEARFLTFLDARTIPRPATNVPLTVGASRSRPTASGAASALSSSSTATPRTRTARPSSATARAIGGCRPPAGASCASRGASCTTSRGRSPPSCGRWSQRRRACRGSCA